MAINEGKVIMVGILVVLFLVIGNSAYFVVNAEDSIRIMSGNSIKEVVTGFYQTSSVNQRIFILFQFFLLLLIIVVVLIIIKRLKSKARLSKIEFVKGVRSGARTDIDILYDMLKKYREISISDISKTFKVSPEISMEWAKVLEGGNLAVIEYPRFGKPILELSVQEGRKKETVNGEKRIDEEKLVKEKRSGLQKVVVEKVATTKIGDRKIRKINKKIRKINKKMEKMSKRVKKVVKRSKKVKKR